MPTFQGLSSLILKEYTLQHIFGLDVFSIHFHSCQQDHLISVSGIAANLFAQLPVISQKKYMLKINVHYLNNV